MTSATRPRWERETEHPRDIPLERRSFSRYPWQMAAVAFVALFLGLVLADFFYIVARPLALLFVAVVIAEALSPIVTFIERRGLGRTTAVIAVYLGLLLILIGLGWLVVPSMVSESQQVVDNAPDIVNRLQGWLNQWEIPGQSNASTIVQDQLSQYAGSLTSLPLTVLSWLVEIVLVIFMSLYYLLTVRQLRGFVLSLVPENRRDYAGETMHQIGAIMGGYVRGAVIQGLIIGVLTYIALLIIGVPYPLVLAISAGLLELIPVVGPVITTPLIVGAALLDGFTTAVIALVAWIVIQQFENHILTPNIMRTQTDISPLLIIFAVFAGEGVAGILGALIAIPLAGATKVIVVRVIAPWIRQWAGVRDDGRQEQKQHEGEPA